MISKAIILSIALLFLALLVPTVAVGVVDLDDPPDHRPYTLVPGNLPQFGLVNWAGSYSSRCVDIDGDGLPEFAVLQENYAQVHLFRNGLIHVGNQFNLPGRFTKPTPCGWVDGAWVLDGSGRRELVIGSRTPDGGEIRIWLLDAETMEERLSFPLPVGEDRDGDGLWDGYYMALGPAVVPTPDGPAPALIFACNVRYDEFGRAVLAVDVRDGNILWRRDIANSLPRGNCFLEDLDGDGVPEILLAGSAHDNLDAAEGEHVHGLRDDVPRLFCIGVDGVLRWRVDVPLDTGRLHAVLADTDGDDRLELVLAGSRRSVEQAIVFHDPADGRLLERHPVAHAVTSLVAGADADLYYAMNDGQARRLHRRDGLLRDIPFAGSASRAMVVACGDLLPSPGPELAVATMGATMTILSTDGDWLLQHTVEGRSQDTMEVVPMGGGRREITVPNYDSRGQSYLVVDVPRPFPWLPVSTASALLALAGLAVWLRRTASPADTLDPRSRRLLLLERLEQMDHNRIGALHAVRDLSHKLAVAGPATPGRVAEITARLRAKTFPRLRSILDLAAAVEIPGHRVARARAAVDDVERRLDDGTVDRAAAADREEYAVVRNAADETEAAFTKLREEAIALFSTDLADTATDVLRGLADAAAAADASLSLEGPSPLPVHCDSEDLEFMLENLVTNALRAVAGRSTRRVTLSWRQEKRAAVLEVNDTGCGIPPADRDRILGRRDLTRDSGGLGLPRSRRLARRYDGDLDIVAGGPGEGSTFRLELPVAAPPAGA